MRRTVSYEEMLAFLKGVAKPGFITITEEARSTEGRKVLLVRLNRGGARARFRVLYYAQQHGDEVAGKDALLTLIRDLAAKPELLPEDVDLYLMPMLNPDGAVAHRRFNGAGADLNRDHLLLAQPETRALHRVARRLRPHLAVDSHEFGRDSEDYAKRGWEAWPVITMDGCNHPLIPDYLKAAALEAVTAAAPLQQKAGHAYRRYLVGGPPPDEELRPSTPEVDDGRNGLGTLGALSLIIEAGVRHRSPDPQADLGERVDGYRILYRHLLGDRAWRDRILKLAERARREPLPPFIATNTFWANAGGKVSAVKVRELATGRTLEVPTAMAMTDLVVKGAVPTPRAYAIEPAAAARFLPVLEAQGLRWETLASPRRAKAERVRLLRIEEPYDELYQRYKDRQIVERQPQADVDLPAGTVLVPLDQDLARRAIQVLEPCLLYGLYGYPGFRELAKPGADLPVTRIF
ncbi:MAG: succinylglutamate desuccinylase/aspartoacylase family protein [Holophagaceae bacterium]|nr:succinylglutamate desuccinylase/aspartoacylase family protein [Holophagaceae bacterium]